MLDNVTPIRETSLPGEALTFSLRGRELDLVRAFAKRLGTIEQNVALVALGLGLAELRKRLSDPTFEKKLGQQFEKELKILSERIAEFGKPTEPVK